MTGRTTTRRGGSALLAVIGVVLLLAAAVLGWIALSGGLGGEEPDGIDLNGNPVTFDPGEGLSDDQRSRQDATPDGYGRFVVPSVGLDVSLGAMREVDGVVTPPGFSSAYWLTNRGTTLDRPDAGTVYVAMHSLRGGGVGPGNFFFDVDSGTARVEAGAEISVDDVVYVVDATEIIDKAALPRATDVWAAVPDRLVVITCLQRPDNAPSTANFVVTAHRAG